MRIPFLGKRRKSLAALNANSTSKQPGHARNATASLSVQDLNRLHSYNAQDHLELPPLSVSPFKIGNHTGPSTPQRPAVGSRNNSATPSAYTPLSSAHSHGSASTRPASTSEAYTYTTPTSKRTSEKSKSFFARVSVRPALLSRKSSADLRCSTSVKPRSPVSVPIPDASTPSRPRPPITRLVNQYRHDLGDDKNFFTSPRTAPSPPNLTFTPAEPSDTAMTTDITTSCSAPATSPSLLAEAHELEAQNSQTFRPLSHQVHPYAKDGMDSRARVKHYRANAHPDPFFAPTSSNAKTVLPTSQSTQQKSSPIQRQEISILQVRSSSQTPKVPEEHYNNAEASATKQFHRQRRQGTVQIGRSKVTLSVADVLEAGLGVEVGNGSDDDASLPKSDDEGFEDDDLPIGMLSMVQRPKDKMKMDAVDGEDRLKERLPQDITSSGRDVAKGNAPMPMPTGRIPPPPEASLPDPLRNDPVAASSTMQRPTSINKGITSLSPKSPLSELMISVAGSTSTSLTGSEELDSAIDVYMRGNSEDSSTSPFVSTGSGSGSGLGETGPRARCPVVIGLKTGGGGKHAHERTLSNARSFCLPFGARLGSDDSASAGDVLSSTTAAAAPSRLKRHSTASSSSLTSARETQALDNGNHPATIKRLQNALTVQNARFDKLVQYVLTATQKFQEARGEYERRIEALKGEVKEKEDEVRQLNRRLRGREVGPVQGERVTGKKGKEELWGEDGEEHDEGREYGYTYRNEDVHSPSVRSTSGDTVNDTARDQQNELRRARTMPDLSRAAACGGGSGSPDIPVPSVPPPNVTRTLEHNRVTAPGKYTDRSEKLAPSLSPSPASFSASSSCETHTGSSQAPSPLCPGLGLEFPLPQPLSLPSFASSLGSLSASGSTSTSVSTSSSRTSLIALPTTPAGSAPYGLATILEGATPSDSGSGGASWTYACSTESGSLGTAPTPPGLNVDLVHETDEEWEERKEVKAWLASQERNRRKNTSEMQAQTRALTASCSSFTNLTSGPSGRYIIESPAAYGASPATKREDAVASTAYARNLNKGRGPSIVTTMMSEDRITYGHVDGNTRLRTHKVNEGGHRSAGRWQE